MRVRPSSYVSHILAGVVGATMFFANTQYEALGEAQAKIKKLEADVRTASGKFLDLQERMDDEIQAARGEASVELWNTQQALETCQKAAKK